MTSIVRHVYVDGQKIDVFTGNPAVAASPRLIHTGGAPAQSSSAGTDTTPSVTETYLSEIFVPFSIDTTNVMLFNGSAVAGHVVVGVYDVAGTLIGKSEPISQSGIDAYQRFPLAVSLVPGTYYIAVQFDSTSARFNTRAFGAFGAGKITGQTFGVMPSGLTMPTTFTANLGPIASLYAFIGDIPPSADWPWGDADTLWDLELTTTQLYSALLGEIDVATAFTEGRASTALVFDGNGLLQSIPANVPAIGTGRGLWAQAGGSVRLDFNNTLSNAAWTKTNITAAQDLPSPFSAGTPAGWRITATSDGGTITQSASRVTAGATTTMSLPHAVFYWNGTPLTGAVEITQDNVVWTDISSQLVSGKWVQLAGAPQLLADLPDPNTFGIRIAKSGDSVGFCLANIERGYTVTSPILTASAATGSRAEDFTKMNMAAFPSLHDKPRFTVLAVVEPRMYPLPAFGDTTKPLLGFTTLEINNPYNISGTGTGSLAPYGGAGQGSLMTITAMSSGAFSVGDRLVVGTGAGSFSDILSQDSGTPGGIGTYHIYSSIYPNGQTTGSITLQSRLLNAQGYGLNAAPKVDEPGHPHPLRIGVTFTSEPYMPDFGNDPQVADYAYNEPNANGWAVDTSILKGVIALKGDTELTHDNQFTHAPELISSLVITLGCQGPLGGGPLDGVLQRVICIGRAMSQAEIAAATILLQARYA